MSREREYLVNEPTSLGSNFKYFESEESPKFVQVMEDLSQFSQFVLMDSDERLSNTVYSYTPSFDIRED